MFSAVLFTAIAESGADPITAILNRDWAALGGWSLFVTLCLVFVFSMIRENLVPGRRYRRLEDSAKKSEEALKTVLDQNSKLITSNQIVEHFFRETAPKRERSDDV